MIPLAIRRLDELAAPLDRSSLHVFVVGPGRGEAIAVALPERGWLLFDGATTELGRPPLVEILDRWRARSDDPIEWALLSHPHDDHVDGFAEVINAHPPNALALAGVDGAPRYVDILRDAPLPPARDDAIKALKVRTAFKAIRRWERDVGKKPAAGVHRGHVLVDRGALRVHVLSPPPTELGEYLHVCAKKPAYLKSDANRYSLVVEVAFGDARIILPGDLPRTVKRAAVVPGWDELIAAAPHVCDHSALKVPHHGSAEAIHPGVMTAGEPDRAWVITPYNSARLPSVANLDGLPAIVATRRRVLLSALPLSKSVQGKDADGIVSLDQIVSRMKGQGGGSAFKDSRDVQITPGSAREPLDCVWCVSINRAGQIVGLHRGPAALSVEVPT